MIDKDELKDLLKKYLAVEVEFTSQSTELTVRVYFDDELVASDNDYPSKDNDY